MTATQIVPGGRSIFHDFPAARKLSRLWNKKKKDQEEEERERQKRLTSTFETSWFGNTPARIDLLILILRHDLRRRWYRSAHSELRPATQPAFLLFYVLSVYLIAMFSITNGFRSSLSLSLSLPPAKRLMRAYRLKWINGLWIRAARCAIRKEVQRSCGGCGRA